MERLVLAQLAAWSGSVAPSGQQALQLCHSWVLLD
jgi:hypothetical protein